MTDSFDAVIASLWPLRHDPVVRDWLRWCVRYERGRRADARFTPPPIRGNVIPDDRRDG